MPKDCKWDYQAEARSINENAKDLSVLWHAIVAQYDAEGTIDNHARKMVMARIMSIAGKSHSMLEDHDVPF